MSAHPCRRTLLITLAALAPLAGCGFSPPLSASSRQALDTCRSDADRVFDAQNRYQLSERTDRDTPFSGGTPPANPSDGLSDQYQHQEMVSDCLRHSDAVPVQGQP